LEVAIEQIPGDRHIVLSVSGNDIFAFPSGFDAVLPHKPLNTFFRTRTPFARNSLQMGGQPYSFLLPGCAALM
jgi:hypothetical protein